MHSLDLFACITVRCDLINGKSFSLFFNRLVPPTVTFPTALLAIQGGVLSCSARGTLPIYTALIRNSIVLANISNTATIRLDKDGNYICQATNKHGTDVKELQVNFTSKRVFFGLISLFLSNIVHACKSVSGKLEKTPCKWLSGSKALKPCTAKTDGLETIT